MRSASSLSDWGLRLIAANDFGGCRGAGRWIGCRKRLKGPEIGVSWGPVCRAGALRPHQAGTRANIRLMFQAMVTRLHSPRPPARPRSENYESQRRFDDPEHRLRHLLAQHVKRPARRRLQPMRHRLDRRWILRRFRRRLEAFGQRRMIRLTAHGDQRFDPRLVASRDVRRAEIAGIRQQAFGLAQFVGSLDLVSIGSSCCLSLGAWLTAPATTSRLPAATAALAL